MGCKQSLPQAFCTAWQPEACLSSCSMYLKRLRCRQSTRGSALICIHFCASCSPPHRSQKNLSSASSVSVALRARNFTPHDMSAATEPSRLWHMGTAACCTHASSA